MVSHGCIDFKWTSHRYTLLTSLFGCPKCVSFVPFPTYLQLCNAFIHADSTLCLLSLSVITYSTLQLLLANAIDSIVVGDFYHTSPSQSHICSVRMSNPKRRALLPAVGQSAFPFMLWALAADKLHVARCLARSEILLLVVCF